MREAILRGIMLSDKMSSIRLQIRRLLSGVWKQRVQEHFGLVSWICTVGQTENVVAVAEYHVHWARKIRLRGYETSECEKLSPDKCGSCIELFLENYTCIVSCWIR
jgi:hypothetical protein